MTAAEAADLFPLAFRRDTPFGTCAGVDLRAALEAGPAAVAACLHPAERPPAAWMRGARLVEFAGGRAAARLAGAGAPILRDPDGSPRPPPGTRASISHCRSLAVALVTQDASFHPGVDIEPLDSDGPAELLAGRILAEAERTDAAADGFRLLERLALKEAAYKALHPIIGHVRLRDIVVARGPDGTPRVEAAGSRRGVTAVAAAIAVIDGHVLAIAAARPIPRRAAPLATERGVGPCEAVHVV